jgi:hypothetical protein
MGSTKLELESKWSGSDVKKCKLADTGGHQFALNRASFMKAFHSLS